MRILKDLDRDIAGRHVIVVEDIVDSGLTLSWLLKYLASRSAASIDVVTLLRKPDADQGDGAVRYVGFDIPNEFVVGYGLDYAERYRELPFVAVLKPSVYRRVLTFSPDLSWEPAGTSARRVNRRSTPHASHGVPSNDRMP